MISPAGWVLPRDRGQLRPLRSTYEYKNTCIIHGCQGNFRGGKPPGAMAGSSRSRRVWTARLAAVATRLLIHLRRPAEPRHPTNARIICRKWKINCISDADHDWAWRRAWCRFLSSALWRHGHAAGRPSWWLGEAIPVWHSNAFKVSICTIRRARWVVCDVDSILLKEQCSFDVYSLFTCRLLRLSAAIAIGCLLHNDLLWKWQLNKRVSLNVTPWKIRQ